MDAPDLAYLVDRDDMVGKGIDFKRAAPDLNDLQVLSIMESDYTFEVLETIDFGSPYRLAILTLMGFVFGELRGEILAQPPLLSFDGFPTIRTKGLSDSQSKQLDLAAKNWKAACALRVDRHNNSGGTPTTSTDNPHIMAQTEPKSDFASNIQAPADTVLPASSVVPVEMAKADVMNNLDAQPQAHEVKSLVLSNKATPSMSEANSVLGTNIKTNDPGPKVSSMSSRVLVATAQAKSSTRSGPTIQSDEAGSSTFTTEARLNWQPSNSDDPFGVRVSTNELASDYPFELANNAKHSNVRDNILYDLGCRDATAHFPVRPDQIIQPLQPGQDHMPEPVKAIIAANNARTGAANAEEEAAKAEALKVVGAQEIVTASGLREVFTSTNPTYIDTVFAAITAAKLDPVAQVDGNAAYEYIKAESLTKLRAELKAKAKEYRPAVIKEEEYKSQSSTHSPADTPTKDQELPGKAWTFPVADRTLDAAQLHYNMMYEVVTKLQRDRLELGPEVSDYEVISRAHAGYVSTEKEEAAALARAANVQKTKALATSVEEQLLEAQAKGHPVTCVGELELSQMDIADILIRCQQVGGSSSAANDYINAKAGFDKLLHNDIFTKSADINAEGAKPATIAQLIDCARAGITENIKLKTGGIKDRFEAAADRIERDLRAMKALKGKIVIAPRDFTAEILEIQQELAELKAHRAAYPGDPADLVPDSIDDPGFIGIAVHPNDFGETPYDENASASASASAAAAVTGAGGAKKPSRAEQRRAARQKAKGKGKA